MAGLGEHTGDMSIAMRQLSLILIRKESINRRLIHAITYPTLTLFASIMAFFIIISIVVPKFQAIFEKFHLKLPLFTQLLLGFAGFCKDYGIILLLALCIAFMTVYYFYRQNENFKLKIDSLLLKIPILGSVIQLGVAGRFALILYSLANTGVPIIKSLEIARDGIKNISLRTDISVVIESIKTGSDLSSAFKYSTIYDALCLGLISSGEQSGSIVEMFEKIYEYYEQKFETKVQFLTTILEPLMVMMVGIVVMILAIGIFVPLWDMTAMARR
jgi:type II secretory pathway component PulF